jgi:hypothetical protein
VLRERLQGGEQQEWKNNLGINVVLENQEWQTYLSTVSLTVCRLWKKFILIYFTNYRVVGSIKIK